jgi:hypothetical protein
MTMRQTEDINYNGLPSRRNYGGQKEFLGAINTALISNLKRFVS